MTEYELHTQGASQPSDVKRYSLQTDYANGVGIPAMAGDSGLGWQVRERRDSDGELLDCFVEAPQANGMAYGLEVLGDDYTGYGDVGGKLEHCRMIVAWANTRVQPASGEDAR